MSIVASVIRNLRFSGTRYHCIVCGRHLRKFFPFSTNLQNYAKRSGFVHDFRRMETLNFDNCNCPFCLSSDRERLYLVYLMPYFGGAKRPLKILDFAPSPAFAGNLRSRQGLDYTSADLMAPHVDIHIDICNMTVLVSGSYDLVICSHVLEHVASPETALQEIHRILKPDGFSIIMVPLFWDVTEFVENPEFDTETLRRKHYGQDDHVRLYDRKTFLYQLDKAGFLVEEVTPDKLDPQLVRKNAIADNSVLYVCRKRNE